MLIFTTISRAVSRCIGAARFCLASMSSAVPYGVGSVTHTTGRLAQTIVQGNCLFEVMGQESCQVPAGSWNILSFFFFNLDFVVSCGSTFFPWLVFFFAALM